MIVFETGCGMPMWRSVHRRICGPSLSRKNRLSAVKLRNTASEVSPPTTVPSPWISVSNASLTPELAASAALLAVLAPTPASWSQPWILSTACWSPLSRLSPSPTIPASTSTPRAPPASSSATNTMTVAAARGMRRARLATAGDRTAARIVAVMTGTTIVSISDNSATVPASSAMTPTSSQAVTPMSRSHPGAANIPDRSSGWTSTTSPS